MNLHYKQADRRGWNDLLSHSHYTPIVLIIQLSQCHTITTHSSEAIVELLRLACHCSDGLKRSGELIKQHQPTLFTKRSVSVVIIFPVEWSRCREGVRLYKRMCRGGGRPPRARYSRGPLTLTSLHLLCHPYLLATKPPPPNEAIFFRLRVWHTVRAIKFRSPLSKFVIYSGWQWLFLFKFEWVEIVKSSSS